MTTGAACGGGTQDGATPDAGADDAGAVVDAKSGDAAGGDAGRPVVETCGSAATGPGGDAGMADGGRADTGTGDGPGPLPDGFSYDLEYEMRFTSFEFSDGSPGTSANPFLELFFDQSRRFPIVVLIHMRKISPDEGSLELRGGAGLKADKSAECDDECKYQWDPESPDTYYEMRLDGETGQIQGSLDELEFVGTTELGNGEVEKFLLPIRDLDFRDVHLRPTDSGDGVAVKNGMVEGYITYEAAEEARVRVSSGGEGTKISSLLGEDQMNYDSDDDGEIDSWCLQADFSAGETNIVE